MPNREKVVAPECAVVGTIRLEATLEAPAQARAFLRKALRISGRSHLIADASLLVSEVTTNAVVHARSPVEVVVGSLPDGIRVEVSDGDAATAPEQVDAASDAERGRGLALVDALASAWGYVVDADGTGKVVWFEIRGG